MRATPHGNICRQKYCNPLQIAVSKNFTVYLLDYFSVYPCQAVQSENINVLLVVSRVIPFIFELHFNQD